MDSGSGMAVPLLLSSPLLECFPWATGPAAGGRRVAAPLLDFLRATPLREAEALHQSSSKISTHREKARRREILLHNKIYINKIC